jgi:membrane-bound lytic murein transglycosylase D
MTLIRLLAAGLLAVSLHAYAQPSPEPVLATPERIADPLRDVMPPSLNALHPLHLTPQIKPLEDLRDESSEIATIDLTAPQRDIWQRIRNGFAMPDIDDPLVARHQAWYLNRPATLKISLNRSRRYLFHIVEELEKRGMPTELALLPVIESSFNPQAHSPARALGMWQFIPSTGKNYNLKQNWWLDERRDILASTTAALGYLQTIYEMNGDWHVALASYNWGEGAVARAMAKNQAQGLPTDYLSLRMPAETRNYVPKLQAVKNIIANPMLFQFDLDPIPNEPYFGTVDVDGDVDLDIAAQLAEISLTEFIALNPAYHRPMIPGAKDSPLVVPADKVQTFMANLQRYEEAKRPLSNWSTYTLKPKESIDTVAKRLGINAARLRQINSITKKTKIHAGLVLLLPGKNVISADKLAGVIPSVPDTSPRVKKPGKSEPLKSIRESRRAKPVKSSAIKKAVNNANKKASAKARKPAPAKANK